MLVGWILCHVYSQDPAELGEGVWVFSNECGYLLQGLGDNASAVCDVLDSLAFHKGLKTQLVGASGLVAQSEVGVRAPLVNTEGAGRVGNVEEREVVADPRVSLLAAGDKVHGVRSSEGKGLVLGQEEVLALAHVNILVSGRNATAHDGVLGRGLASDEVVVSIVGDVVGATGSVNLEKVDAAAVGRDANAHLVAADSAGPVGDAVSVDLATKHTNRGRENVVRGDGDGFALGGNGEGSGAGREGCNGGNGEEHF